jgi:transcriptional regulator with XRE-family HTH domain
VNRPELARALRRARARLTPGDVGLPANGRRRVAGLRREEVAALAGVSVDYVVRLEQGRGPRPSGQVLAALARALRMGDGERRELFELAEVAPPLAGEIRMLVRSSVLRLLDRLDTPATVLSAKADVLAWNPMAAALLGDFSQLPARERNLARMRFLGGRSRVAHDTEGYRRTAAHTVANLRRALARYPDDPGLARLLADLRASAEFRQLWEQAAPAGSPSHTKTVLHPELGPITLECDTMTLPDADQSVVVYSAEPGSAAAEALALLRVIGTQRLTAST